MKAVNNEGKITFYQSVPNSFRSSTGLHYNVKHWSADKMKENGLFDVIIDNDYDSRIHDLGEIYWDTEASVFRKDLVDKTWSKSLIELKEQKINNFKHSIGNKLAETDWYIIRNIDNGTEIPGEIQEARQELRNQSDSVESEINALTTKKAVVSFDLPNFQ